MKSDKKPISILIADDEPLAREGVRQLLALHADVTIVAEAHDGVHAVELIEEMKPDLVFLDIQMPELDGFGVIKEIGVEGMPTTIFVTAYDEFALKAFEVHAFDYLLKPIESERFAEALDRARTQIALKDTTDSGDKLRRLLESLQPNKQMLQRLAIKSTGKITFVNTADIEWIQANGDYVWIHAQGKKSLLREKISDLNSKLDPQQFVRIHRSTLVNIDRIKDLEPMFYGDYAVNLHNGTKLTLSRSYRDKLFSLLHLNR
jgi:two-component system, LytTR family, response regulator